jgi:hypothetical protein
MACLTALFLPLLAAPALATGSLVGEPQPEAAPFAAGSPRGGGGGSGVLLPSGSIVLVSGTASGSINVCVVQRFADRCTATTTIRPPAPTDDFGVPIAVATGGNDVAIVVSECCSLRPDDLLVYDSTDGGRTFGPYAEAGTLVDIRGAAFVGGQIVAVGYPPSSDGVDLQAFSPTPSSPQTGIVNLSAGNDYAGDAAVSSFQGGLLVAYDLPAPVTPPTTSYLYFAPSGSTFSSAASYELAATIPNVRVTGLSDGVLLTQHFLTPVHCAVQVFDGTALGSPRTVPVLPTSGNPLCTISTSGSSIHVFQTSYDYEGDALIEASTTASSPWTQRKVASGSPSLFLPPDPVLDPTGRGVAFEVSVGALDPVLGQPVLDTQSPTLVVGSVTRPNGPVVLKGTVTPIAAGRAVVLLRLVAGHWYAIKSTSEQADGQFTFRVPDADETLRAVVSDVPGYEFGYSRPLTLHRGS